LRRLVNHQRKEPIVVAEDTIEQILPQNPVLPSTWREALGGWRSSPAPLLLFVPLPSLAQMRGREGAALGTIAS
jgi:hypothetical protein